MALAPLVEKMIAAHSLPARAKMMNTRVEMNAPGCQAEPTLLLSAIDNLYSNAIHYGDNATDILLCSRQQGNSVIIEIVNSGPPVPEAEKNMIFEPFYQGSRQRKGAVKGSGLGLSIARDCVRRMKGSLQLVDERPGTVCFRIPLARPDAGNPTQ